MKTELNKNEKLSMENETPPIANRLAGRCFIIKFDNGNEPFYIAGWEGDPGRTLFKFNAKQFRNQKVAEKALKKAVKDYPQRNLVGKVVEYNAR
jgi:hypothetical protein